MSVLQSGDLRCLWGPSPGCKVRMEQRGMRRGQLSADPAALCNHSHVLYEMRGVDRGQKRADRRRQWHPTPVLLPGKSHGLRSLVGCSPWGS